MLEKITDTDAILKLAYLIGYKKRELPSHLRGYANVLGLYVQLRDAGGLCRLQAGGKLRHYFDAWGDFSSLDYDILPYSSEVVPSWEIRDFDARTWEHRFAHLLGPTFEITRVLDSLAYAPPNLEPSLVALYQTYLQAIQRAEQTGQWTPIPGYTCLNCRTSIPYWRMYVDGGTCLQCGATLERMKD